MKKYCILLTVIILCLSFSACGLKLRNKNATDWRESGSVTVSGNINRNGSPISVCVCVHSDNAVFYYDTVTQTEYSTAAFPVGITDAADNIKSTSFEDLNFDGDSDFTVELAFNDGRYAKLCWFWNSDKGFIFSDDLSDVYDFGYPTEKPLYFDMKDIPIECTANGKIYSVKRSVCQTYSDKNKYASAEWFIDGIDVSATMNNSYTFTVVCGVPDGSFSESGAKYGYSVFAELFDSYTGKWLAAVPSAESKDGIADYVYTVTRSGKEYEISFSVTDRWKKDADYQMVLYKTYTVYGTDGYDGVVLGINGMNDELDKFLKGEAADKSYKSCLIDEIPGIKCTDGKYFAIK